MKSWQFKFIYNITKTLRYDDEGPKFYTKKITETLWNDNEKLTIQICLQHH